MTSDDHEWARQRQRQGDTMHGEGGHGINDCPFAPSVQELAGLDRSVWDTRWNGAGPSGKEAFLARQAARQQGTAPGATYVTTTSSRPYTRPGVPCPVHVVSHFWARITRHFSVRHVAGVADYNG